MPFPKGINPCESYLQTLLLCALRRTGTLRLWLVTDGTMFSKITPAFLVVIYFPRWTKLTQTLFKPAVVLFAISLERFFFFLCVCILFLQVFVIFIGLLFRQTLPTNPNQAAQVPGVPGRYFGADDLCSFCFPQWTAGNRPNVYFQQNLGRKPNALLFPIWSVSGFNVVAARQGHFLFIFLVFYRKPITLQNKCPPSIEDYSSEQTTLMSQKCIKEIGLRAARLEIVISESGLLKQELQQTLTL